MFNSELTTFIPTLGLVDEAWTPSTYGRHIRQTVVPRIWIHPGLPIPKSAANQERSSAQRSFSASLSHGNDLRIQALRNASFDQSTLPFQKLSVFSVSWSQPFIFTSSLVISFLDTSLIDNPFLKFGISSHFISCKLRSISNFC